MKYLFPFAVSLFFVSCAQQRLVLEQRDFVPFKDLDQVSQIGFVTQPMKVVNVMDARSSGVSVGEARTGARFEKTPVFTSGNSPEEFVKMYLESALRKRGALIVESDQKIELSATITELWVEEVIEKYQPEKAKCKASLDIHSQKNGEKFSATYWTEVVSPGDLGDATEKLAPTLASCLNAIAEKIVKDKKFGDFARAKPLI